MSFRVACLFALLLGGPTCLADGEWWLGGMYEKTCKPTGLDSSVGEVVEELGKRGKKLEVLPVPDPVKFYLLQGTDDDGEAKVPVTIAKSLHECTFGQEYSRIKLVTMGAKMQLGHRLEAKLTTAQEIKVMKQAAKDFNEQFDRELSISEFAKKYQDVMKRAKGK